MEVILREDYISLGYTGDKVKVRRGFARNFLIPRGIAVESTSTNEKQLRHKLSAIVSKRIKKKAEAEAFAKVLGQVIVEFTVKVGAQGKSFGSITSRDIESSLKSLGYEVDRRQIRINETIKGPGVYTVEVKLHSEVAVPLQVKVMAQQQPAATGSEDRADRGKKKASKKLAEEDQVAGEVEGAETAQALDSSDEE